MRTSAVCAVLLLALTSCRIMDTRHGQMKPPPGMEDEDAPKKKWRFGAEVAKYPVGWQGGLIAVYPLMPDDDFTFRLGYNYSDRGTNGEQFNEEGGGPGFGFAAHHYFSPREKNGWMVGARIDFWWLDIEWSNPPVGVTPGTEGETNTFTVQPVLEGGYIWRFSAVDLALLLGLGYEWNAHIPAGQEKVGDGLIGLVTLRTVL